MVGMGRYACMRRRVRRGAVRCGAVGLVYMGRIGGERGIFVHIYNKTETGLAVVFSGYPLAGIVSRYSLIRHPFDDVAKSNPVGKIRSSHTVHPRPICFKRKIIANGRLQK